MFILTNIYIRENTKDNNIRRSILLNVPRVELPFTYTVLLCPLAVTWYILIEDGSIIENAGALGVPIPA